MDTVIYDNFKYIVQYNKFNIPYHILLLDNWSFWLDLKYRLDEVQRKIGRNLLLLQKMEHLLKYLVLHSKISGPIDQLNDIREQLKDKLQTQSMGVVLSQYLEQIKTTSNQNMEDANIKGDSSQILCEIEYNYTNYTDIEYDEKKSILNKILEERNDLVHHMILNFDESSIDGCRVIEIKLDEQRNCLLPELKDLQSKVKILHEVQQKYLELAKSGRLEKDFYYLYMVENFPLIVELAKISIKKHRSDGWVSLGLVGKMIRQDMPDEVKKLKEKYASRTLKSLISETKIFEIKEDVSKNMVLYKLVPEWKEYFEQVSWKKDHRV